MNESSVRVEDTVSKPIRVDRYLADHVGLLTRSQLKTRVSRVLINGAEAKLSKSVRAGDSVTVFYEEATEPDFAPEPVALSILFENADVIVLDKPQGMVVHPANGHYSGTLVQGIMYHCERLRAAFPEDEIRPGIVHRLDKETSGVIIAAKNGSAREHLAAQFRDKTAAKRYIAIVKGSLPRSEGTVSGGIERDPRNRKRFRHSAESGKAAETSYRVIRDFGGYSFCELRPQTGRTHQLRVHMRALGCPILGDPLYARRDDRFPEASLMLHAYSLSLVLPGDAEQREFRAPVPERFRATLRTLRNPDAR